MSATDRQRCQRCGEYREPDQLAEFIHVRSGAVRIVCSSRVKGGCWWTATNEFGPAPSAGGVWRLMPQVTR